MWQLLKGHEHLQDEFSIFFDHLRPSASRLGDFEEIHWTEEKDYEFDGFEEVSLPDMEEEEEPPKIHAASKNKRRKEMGSQNAEKVKIQPPPPFFFSKPPPSQERCLDAFTGGSPHRPSFEPWVW
ncbi:GON-4-like protein [Pseudonaja textilis]|uniref:GON-4-like protein n=1 Tax=Pseudonaja textilis TaxID=8673 RepID=UPI000EA8B5C5|nr:GON-4-like protein [Pseudonaja textilis]